MKKESKKLCLQVLLLLSLCLVITVIFSNFIGFNMDEFAGYRVLACLDHPNGKLDPNKECRKKHYMNIFNSGLYLPLHEYGGYLGSFSSFYYYPLFLVWKSPVSARFLGLIFLTIGALILSITFRMSLIPVFFGLLLFFPYFFQHIVDTGPVKYPILSVFLIYYLFVRWFQNFRMIYLILISMLIFLGFWSKLTYAWYIPGIVILFLMGIVDHRRKVSGHFKKIFSQCLIAAFILFLLLGVIFLSTKPDSDKRAFLERALENSKEKMTHQSELKVNFLNPLQSTQRVYKVLKISLIDYIYSGFIYLTVPLLWFILLVGVDKKSLSSKRDLWKSMILYFAFICTVIFQFLTSNANRYHHNVLTFPFLILSFLLIISCYRSIQKFKINFVSTKKIILTWFLIFILFNGYFFVKFPSQKVDLRGALQPDDPVTEILSDEYLVNNYAYIASDWGLRFQQELYGNKAQVDGKLLAKEFKKMKESAKLQEVDRFNKLAESRGRKLLFLHRESLGASLINLFDLKSCSLAEGQADWKISLQPDDNEKNICFRKS